MKKLLIIAVAPVLALSVTGAVLALKPDAEPKRVEVQQSASVETQEQTTAIQEETVAAQPAVESTEPIESPPSVTNPYIENSPLWYVWGKRAELGRTLPTNWGNGGSWNERAKVSGMTVDTVPEVGAVVELQGGGVGIVETINADGTVLIRYMPDHTVLFSVEKAASTFYIH